LRIRKRSLIYGAISEALMGLFSWLKKKEEPPGLQPGRIDASPIAGGVVVLKVSGVVSPAVMAEAQKRILAIAGRGGKLRGLIVAEGFQGFAKGFDGGMSEIERMSAIDEKVERMAVVADGKWHEQLRLFMLAGMRQTDIRFFGPAEKDAARAWLQGS
jgi:hypothetical protein